MVTPKMGLLDLGATIQSARTHLTVLRNEKQRLLGQATDCDQRITAEEKVLGRMVADWNERTGEKETG